MNAAIALALPFVAALGLMALLLRSRWTERLADHPNERSLHSRAKPRIGGIAIVLATLPVAAWFGGSRLEMVWALALGLSLVSFADDLRSLPISIRISAHVGASAIAVAALVPQFPHAHLLIAAALALALAWMTNLYNFMDGSDGLAGGMAVIGFGAYAIAAAQSGATNVALASLAIASGAAAFLVFNFPPARLFMGDAGSIPLGFLAGVLGMHGAVAEIWPSWFPLLVFSPFIVDASVTLARRALAGEAFWRAHRSHSYQRLVLEGWSPRRLALCAYALMIAASASAIATCMQERETQYAILGLWSAMYVASIVAIERRTSQSATQRGRGPR